jgi:hypothetical protein
MKSAAARLVVAALAWSAVAAAGYGVRLLAFGPRPVFVHVRWAPDVDEASRRRLEERFSLTEPRPSDARTWGYTLVDVSRDNVRALVGDAAAEDTHYIHRTAYRPWRRRA